MWYEQLSFVEFDGLIIQGLLFHSVIIVLFAREIASHRSTDKIYVAWNSIGEDEKQDTSGYVSHHKVRL